MSERKRKPVPTPAGQIKVAGVAIPRMFDWMILTVLLFVIVLVIAPQQLGLVVYKASLVSLAAVMTYAIDRSLFARVADRLDERMPRDILSASRVLCRGIMFLGCVLGITMGL